MSTLMYKFGSSWIDVIHPVGSMWLSNSSKSPSSLFGGTWQQLTNAVLRAAAGYGYGGSDSMTLTTSNIPAHTHSIQKLWTFISSTPDRLYDLRTLANANNTLQATNSVTTASTGGGKRFQSFPVIATSIAGSELANGRKGVL